MLDGKHFVLLCASPSHDQILECLSLGDKLFISCTFPFASHLPSLKLLNQRLQPKQVKNRGKFYNEDDSTGIFVVIGMVQILKAW